VTGESYTQSAVRLAATARGETLWRNNVGVLPNKAGVPVRFGLANDSKVLNEKLKSSDLIGWQSRVITPEMVGRTIAVFVSYECKRPGWSYCGDPRERAQKRWLDLVRDAGGVAEFRVS
jgi:hypothetical protein